MPQSSNFLRKRVMWLLYVRRFGRLWANSLTHVEAWPLPGVVRGKGKGLFVQQLNLEISEPSLGALAILQGLNGAIKLAECAGATISVKSDAAYVTIGQTSIRVENYADLGVVYEVFAEEPYGFERTGDPFVVDMGGNIGASSLYFASVHHATVWTYELVPSTAAIAEQNIQRNPHLSSRIHLQNVGVSDRDLSLKIAVDKFARASNSVWSPHEYSSDSEEVKLIDVANEFVKWLDAANGKQIVLKIDIEGAEYEVLSALDKNELLPKVDLVFIEHHPRTDRSVDEIFDLLRRNGFRWFARQHGQAPVGYITGWNSQQKLSAS